MKFKLKKSLFDLLIDIPEIEPYIVDKIQNDDCIDFNIDTQNVREVQLLINDEIVLNGLDNQDTVNSLGLKLYRLYDEILYQKENQ